MRKQIAVAVTEAKMQEVGVDWMNQASWLQSLRSDEDVSQINVVTIQNIPMRGCYLIIVEHPDYPEVEDYAEVPVVPFDDPRVIPSGT